MNTENNRPAVAGQVDRELGPTPKRGTVDRAEWLADKLHNGGDYGKEAAALLVEQAKELDFLRAAREQRARAGCRPACGLLARLRSLKVLLGTDSPEVRGWAPAVQQAAQATVNAAISAFADLNAASERLEQTTCKLADDNERLRAALSAVLASDVGRQTLHKLADGQGTDTEDGRAWISAARVMGPNGKAHANPEAKP